jgi:hypothetical protein
MYRLVLYGADLALLSYPVSSADCAGTQASERPTQRQLKAQAGREIIPVGTHSETSHGQVSGTIPGRL